MAKKKKKTRFDAILTFVNLVNANDGTLKMSNALMTQRDLFSRILEPAFSYKS